MRTDISKVICERERFNSSYDYKGTHHVMRKAKRIDVIFDEDDPEVIDNFYQKHGIKAKRFGGGSKSFSDFLSPIIRYIRKSVGRRWDDVFSEMKAAGLNGSGVLQQHVIGHVFQYVTVKTWADEHGNIFGADGRIGQPQFIEGPDAADYMNGYRYRWDNDYSFFVHPTTGILCRPKKVALPKKAETVLCPVKLTDAKHGFVFAKETWFRMTYFAYEGKYYQYPHQSQRKYNYYNDRRNPAILEHLGKDVHEERYHSALIGHGTIADALGNYNSVPYGKTLFIVSVQPANSKEIAKHRLRELSNLASKPKAIHPKKR